ncbi:MAG: hypothetical protein ABSH34_17840 [Verrucomicrobiota bacterium]|jgi:hypothetical protein
MQTTNTKITLVPGEARGPEYLRMPHAAERDPLFGLSRTQLYELVLPSLANDWTPPVRSVVLRRPGAKSGVRLIHVASLRAFIEQHPEPAYQPGSSEGPSSGAASGAASAP